MIPENGFSFGNLVSSNDVYTKIPKFLEYVILKKGYNA